MFYYKNKFKPIVILCAIIVVLAVAVSFCLWDDTSIKNLSAKATTADFKGPFLNGDYKTVINGVKYTVANQGTTAGGQKFVTLLSDDIGLTGDDAKWNKIPDSAHNNGPTAYNASSTIAGRIQTYYNSISNKNVMYNGVSLGKLSDRILAHQEGNWNMWLPSAREMRLSSDWTQASYDNGKQPIMTYYTTNALRKYGNNKWYWLRSPNSTYTHCACSVNTDGSVSYAYMWLDTTAVRVALNLKI